MATRSPGAAPTWLTARTMSFKSTPASNTNMRAGGCETEIVLSGTTTVSPLLNSYGWLTDARSVIEGVDLVAKKLADPQYVAPTAAPKQPTEVVDLMAALQASLQQAEKVA